MTTCALGAFAVAATLLTQAPAQPIRVVDDVAAFLAGSTTHQPFGSHHLGIVVKPVPDLNGDGVTDLLASSLLRGEVIAVSGNDASVLFPIPTEGGQGIFAVGAALMTSDQPNTVHQLAVARLADTQPGQESQVISFVSPANGAETLRAPLPSPPGFGPVGVVFTLENVGDLNDDGVDDLAAGSWPSTNGEGGDSGLIHAVSGATGDTLWVRAFPGARTGYAGIAALDDRNGDGAAEIAVGLPSAENGASLGVALLDGVTGDTLDVVDPPARASRVFGWSVAVTTDGEIAVGDFGLQLAEHPVGRVTIHDPVTGVVTRSITPEINDRAGQFGFHILAGEDFSGDGAPDLAIAAPNSEGSLRAKVAFHVTIVDEATLDLQWAIRSRSAMDFGRSLAPVRRADEISALAVGWPGLRGPSTSSSSGAIAVYAIPGDCYADLTGDGAIDGADLGALLGQWGADPEPGLARHLAANFNTDFVVNATDLSHLVANWGVCDRAAVGMRQSGELRLGVPRARP